MKNRFQILALDGGGIKGLFSAAILAHLEDDLGITITDHFDLIAGTSTGGIIALALGLGLSPKQIVDFYLEQGSSIFPEPPCGRFKRWRYFYNFIHHSKYCHEPLEKALKDCVGEDTLFGKSKKRLIIPAYNIEDDDINLFRTPHCEHLQRDWKVPAWQVARATSAAPTFFPVFKGINHKRLIDGGVWANNPTLVAINEARKFLNHPLESIRVFSLGTTSEVKNRPESLDNGGLWEWKQAAVDVIMTAQSVGTHKQVSLLLDEGNYLRVDQAVPEGLFTLDKLSPERLQAKADNASRHCAPAFKKMFCDYIAPEYIPIYPQAKEGN